MTPSRNIPNYEKFDKPESCDTAKDGASFDLTGAGIEKLSIDQSGHHTLTMAMIHAPDLHETLLSVSQMIENKHIRNIIFAKEHQGVTEA